MAKIIYHTERREHYDALMAELDAKGVMWNDGDKLHDKNIWDEYRGDTCIIVEGMSADFGNEFYYRNGTIKKYTSTLYDMTETKEINEIKFFTERDVSGWMDDYREGLLDFDQLIHRLLSMNLKMYRVETQEDYNQLMVELDKRGVRWIDGTAMPEHNFWGRYKQGTCVFVVDGYANYSQHEFYDTYFEVPFKTYKTSDNELEFTEAEAFDFLEKHRKYGSINDENVQLEIALMKVNKNAFTDKLEFTKDNVVSFLDEFREGLTSINELETKILNMKTNAEYAIGDFTKKNVFYELEELRKGRVSINDLQEAIIAMKLTD